MPPRPVPPSPSPAADADGRAARNASSTVAEYLRMEVTGGLILLIAATFALVLANSPLDDAYDTLRHHHLDIPALGLDLSVEHWASEGLLAIFFFVAGIELKRELLVGELSRPADAVLPAVAAVGGVVVPALLYLAVTVPAGGETSGWAVPMATDIAFVLGVLAVVGRHLPAALRTFLLTLAIVDDLISILVIAVFYTAGVEPLPLAGAVVALLAFRLLHRAGVGGWYLYVPLALTVWVLTYHSGVHATLAGMAVGAQLRVTPRGTERESPAVRLEHLVHPLSAGVAVPLFALLAAGVRISPEGLRETASEPAALGVMLGLVAGKFLGILGSAYLAARFTHARLHPALRWPELAGGAMLAGIGFTVSLLVTELGFAGQPALTDTVKTAVLAASLLSALTGGVLLTALGRRHRRRHHGPDGPALGGGPTVL